MRIVSRVMWCEDCEQWGEGKEVYGDGVGEGPLQRSPALLNRGKALGCAESGGKPLFLEAFPGLRLRGNAESAVLVGFLWMSDLVRSFVCQRTFGGLA
jgi:hypothetical protein